MVKSLGVLVFVVCCALQVAQLEAAECKGGFPTLVTCGTNNKDFNGCITKKILEIVRRFIGGNKALNLASIDPLQVPYPKIVVEDGKGKVELQQCTLTGAKDTKLTNGQFGTFPITVTYDLTVPKFTFVCKQYTMSDGFLNAKKNEGYFTLSMPNYKARFTLTGEAVTQCKEQYLHILTSDSTLPSASDFVAFFSGLGKNQLKKDSLQPLIAKALAKAQARFTFDLLTRIYSFLEPLRIVFPNNTSDNVLSCFQPRPTQCPVGKN